MKNNKILYELSKKYVEDLGYKMPKFEEFEEYESTDEYDEIKTKYITDSEGFLIDEYDYIETEKYTIDSGLYLKNEEIITCDEIKKTNVLRIKISSFDFSLTIHNYIIVEYYNSQELLYKTINLYDDYMKYKGKEKLLCQIIEV